MITKGEYATLAHDFKTCTDLTNKDDRYQVCKKNEFFIRCNVTKTEINLRPFITKVCEWTCDVFHGTSAVQFWTWHWYRMQEHDYWSGYSVCPLAEIHRFGKQSVFYRPQRSCGKVMFSQASVCWQGGLPSDNTTGRQTSPRYSQPVGGAHPTGIHTCFLLELQSI